MLFCYINHFIGEDRKSCVVMVLTFSIQRIGSGNFLPPSNTHERDLDVFYLQRYDRYSDASDKRSKNMNGSLQEKPLDL